ncbi:MAG: hypothetical protein J6U00_14335 [Ruminococcus sp.]|uniref:hypothetical protein n=1 Tax=Ruminococcus sp. TaxID=41978 RepID=UPI001B19CC88|nr:hypothetical protein [Ruminococcus sp.]MBO7475150.1 hypothetical protein [Ruminococcus sp.]
MRPLSMLIIAADSLGELVDIIMWIARCLILVIGGGVGLVYIVRGKTDENPKTFTDGILSLSAAGVLFAATFAVAQIFK